MDHERRVRSFGRIRGGNRSHRLAIDCFSPPAIETCAVFTVNFIAGLPIPA
jgi:hypothetical protein